MTCVLCGAGMKSARENFLYTASGLPNVTLVGVEVRRCPGCGEFEVVLPRVEDLHRTIAHALVRKPAPLTPAEIRYLRKWLGWSGVDFAAHMGVTAETVSRWEGGRKRMGPAADRALRLMVTTRAPIEDYSLGQLKEIEKTAGEPFHLGVQADETGWHAVAA